MCSQEFPTQEVVEIHSNEFSNDQYILPATPPPSPSPSTLATTTLNANVAEFRPRYPVTHSQTTTQLINQEDQRANDSEDSGVSSSDVVHSSDSSPETPDPKFTPKQSPLVPSQIMDSNDPPLVPFPKRKSHQKPSAYQNSRNISDIRSDPIRSGLSSPSDKHSTEVSGSLSYAAMAQRQTTAIIVKSDLAAKDVIVMPPKQQTGNNHLVSVKKPKSSPASARGRRISANNQSNHINTSDKNTIADKKASNQKSSPIKKHITKVQSTVEAVDKDCKPTEKLNVKEITVRTEPEVIKPALPSFAQLLRPVTVAPVTVKPVVVKPDEQSSKTAIKTVSAKPVGDKPTDVVEIAQLKAAIVASSLTPTWHTIKVNGKKRTVLHEEPADFWEEKEEVKPVVVAHINVKENTKEIVVASKEEDSDEIVPVVTRKPKTKKSKSKKSQAKLDHKSNGVLEKSTETPTEDISSTIEGIHIEDDLSEIEEYNFVTDPEAIFANAIAPINIFSSPRSDKTLLSQSGSSGFGGLFSSPNFGIKSSVNHTMLRQEEDMVMRIMRSLSSVEAKSPIEEKVEIQLQPEAVQECSETIQEAVSKDEKKEVEKLVDELTSNKDLISETFLNTEFDVCSVIENDFLVSETLETNKESIMEETTQDSSVTNSVTSDSQVELIANAEDVTITNIETTPSKETPKSDFYKTSIEHNREENVTNGILKIEITKETIKVNQVNEVKFISDIPILLNGNYKTNENLSENHLGNGHAKSNGHAEKQVSEESNSFSSIDQLITGKLENTIFDDVVKCNGKNGNINANPIHIFQNGTNQFQNGCEDKMLQTNNRNGIEIKSTFDVLHLSNGQIEENSKMSIDDVSVKVEEAEDSVSSDTDGCSELSSMDTDDDDRTVVGPLDEYIEDVMFDERDSLNLMASGEFYDGDDVVIDPINDGDLDELIKQAEQIVRMTSDVEAWAKATKNTDLYKEQDRNESPRSSEDSGILENHEDTITSATESESGQSDQYLKFPLTEAVAKWLEEKQKEKSPEPIIRIPEHPILSGQIEKSIQRFQISEMLKSYADDEDEEDDDEDEVNDFEAVDEVSTDESESDAVDTILEPSKNLQSNPLPALSADCTSADNDETDNRVASPQSTYQTTPTICQSLTKDGRRISAQDDPDILEYWENDPMLRAPNRKGGRTIDYAKLLAKVSTKTTIDFMLSDGTPSQQSAMTTAFSKSRESTSLNYNGNKSDKGCVLM